MLDTLFSSEMDTQQKKQLLEKEHHMIMTRELEGEIGSMCNVSEGLWERALKEGISQVIKNMLELNLPLDIIAKSVGVSEEEVRMTADEIKAASFQNVV